MSFLEWLRAHLTRWPELEQQGREHERVKAKANRALAEMRRLDKRRAH